MDQLVALLAAMELLIIMFGVWLMARSTRQQSELIELRARVNTMPTHQDLSELSIELAGVKANTDQTLKLVNNIHSAMMESKR